MENFLYVDIRELAKLFCQKFVSPSEVEEPRGPIKRSRFAKDRQSFESIVPRNVRRMALAHISGDHSAVDPPVPIPNTEVKRCSPDGSATIGCARVGRRQNKTSAFGNNCGGFAFPPIFLATHTPRMLAMTFSALRVQRIIAV